jgi:sulfide dehydrogenase cytochrome subunit
MKYVALVLTSLVVAQAASAAEPPPGATACSGCHPTSKGVETNVPRLIGMKAQDIKTAMHDFQSGARAATVMNRISKGYTEPEAAAIADWYAAQPH